MRRLETDSQVGGGRTSPSVAPGGGHGADKQACIARPGRVGQDFVPCAGTRRATTPSTWLLLSVMPVGGLNVMWRQVLIQTGLPLLEKELFRRVLGALLGLGARARALC
jgi:hypothetical protein